MFKRAYLPYFLVITGVILIFLWARSCNRRGLESFANAGAYKLHMYYASWCPHCHTAKPEFEKLGPKLTIGGHEVDAEAIEAEKEPERVLGEVKGYPTIRLYDPEGKLVAEHEGERTEAGIRAFVEKALQ
jgi:thiol-disulfide isomerase/thioredoxin